MITSKHRGFLTAGILILLLSLSIAWGVLSLIEADLRTGTSIAYADRQYLEARGQTGRLEHLINTDPRFPTYDAFLAYMKKYPQTRPRVDSLSLTSLHCLINSSGESVYRFQMCDSKKPTLIRWLTACRNPQGQVSFHLTLNPD